MSKKPQNCVLVTGAGGFIGSALCKTLNVDGHSVRKVFRELNGDRGLNNIAIGNIDSYTDWSGALNGVDTVVHCAARVHQMRECVTDPLSEYIKVNVEATIKLAEQTIEAGVETFIYISSIKAAHDDSDPYGESKIRSEEALVKIFSGSAVKLIIIRPPLVYGGGVRGNFLSLMKLVSLGFPLPFKAVANKRSMVYIENLVDLLRYCIICAHVPSGVYEVADGAGISTRALINLLAEEFDRYAQNDNRSRFTHAKMVSKLRRGVFLGMKLPPTFYFPLPILGCVMKLLGKEGQFLRLTESLEVDPFYERRVPGWSPPFLMREGISRTAISFFANLSNTQ
ncbi:NAD-dependent epimerase/dehydratase family protein [Polynucleobacter tropicus]|uniref:NAD-dependent epimerase/dehydratase family protein n=1 Tax=Polynucleobacter tropicus TaxID=1743174 RepID=UPI0015708A7A|nr:NAD-dependent epimerase/dehydratase family protein [Polynucleobacter tropicus]